MRVISKESTKDIRIKSIQASDIYYMENKLKPRQDVKLGIATISHSIFTEYMSHKGMKIKKDNIGVDNESLEVTEYNSTDDLIMIKFDYGFSTKYKETLESKYPGNKDRINNYAPISKKKLREHFYENGFAFEIDKKKREADGEKATKTIRYKMLCRTTGAAKKGKCLFIREQLYDKAIKFITMGLFDLLPEKKADIVSLSAYAPLIMAHTYKMCSIPVEHIFFVKDKDVFAKIKAVSVDITETQIEVLDKKSTEPKLNELGYTFYKRNEKKRGYRYIEIGTRICDELKIRLAGVGLDEYYVKLRKVKNQKVCTVNKSDELRNVKSTLWDGESIMEGEKFNSIGGLNGFAYCRSHFFKSAVFPANIQQYFKDYYGDNYENATVTDMLGRKIAVKDIWVISTENSIKWWKFVGKDIKELETTEKAYDYWKKKMAEIDNKFQIVKTGHESKYGDMQRESFQMVNSLPCTDIDKLQGVCALSIEYYNKLRTDIDEFINFLRNVYTADYHIAKVLVALYDWNSEFANSYFFKRKRDDILNKLKIEELMCGKLFQHGDNMTLCGNPMGLLMSVTGTKINETKDEGCFEIEPDAIQCYTKRFQAGEYLAGFRSPHNAANNILHFKNVYPEKLQRYFPDLGQNVIVVNGIGTDLQVRASGCDYDTDFCMVTNNKYMVELAKKAYLEYPSMINNISAHKSSYKKNMLDYALMDNKIASSQYDIGIASDLAQIALSLYFDECANGDDEKKKRALMDIVIKASVLAQCAIDSSKKVFDVSIKGELKRMKKALFEIDNRYPLFLYNNKKYHSNQKVSYIEEKHVVEKMDCPMDIITEIIENDVIDLNKHPEYKTERIKNTDFINLDVVPKSLYIDYKQYDKVKGILDRYDSNMRRLDENDTEYNEQAMACFDKMMSCMKNISLKQELVLYLVREAFNRENVQTSRYLMMLYQKDKDKFLNCFIDEKSYEKVQKKVS